MTDHYALSYDGLNRLTKVVAPVSESFTLDPASNIDLRTGPSQDFGYDQANRLVNDGAQTFTWSNADRLSSRGPDIFGYDALDRLTSSTVGGTARSYTYNGDGLLKSRTQGTATQFLWDPSTSPSRELKQGADNIVYGLGPLYVVKADLTTLTFARDGGKSVRAEINSSGAVTAVFRYRSYGQIAQATTASTPSYLGYAGQLLDPSGLYYMRARWYDPTTATFLSHDPVAGIVGLPITLNAYRYAAANPLMYGDPSGQFAFLAFIPLALPVITPGAVAIWTAVVVVAVGGFQWVMHATENGGSSQQPAADDLVVRGGENKPDNWQKGAQSTDEQGRVTVSGNTGAGATVEELSENIPHRQIGVTTVGQIEQAGGQVILTRDDPLNPYHCDICGLTPQQGSELFRPTRPNPNIR
jgi:RHS repeat-associated protein